MTGDDAKILYESLLDKLKKDHDSIKIKDGVFGAMMEVSLNRIIKFLIKRVKFLRYQFKILVLSH
jgi:hypothetical protein